MVTGMMMRSGPSVRSIRFPFCWNNDHSCAQSVASRIHGFLWRQDGHLQLASPCRRCLRSPSLFRHSFVLAALEHGRAKQRLATHPIHVSAVAFGRNRTTGMSQSTNGTNCLDTIKLVAGRKRKGWGYLHAAQNPIFWTVHFVVVWYLG